MDKECSVLIGGQAGDGTRQAGNVIARLFNRLGYWIFVYEDYPSLIRGGHNFSIIRAVPEKTLAHKQRIDVLVALNQDTIEKQKWRLGESSLLIFDSTKTKAEGLGLPLSDIVKEKKLPPIIRNSVALGALASVLGVRFAAVEDAIRSSIRRNVEENIEVAKEGYELAGDYRGALQVSDLNNPPRPLLTGNEALALGAVKGGLKLYVAYPMTPSSSVLHYLSANANELNIATIQPENEIAVIGVAEGAAYAGTRTMVGTSGGGFCLMVEHLSLAGQAEIPIVIYLSQRPAPATGLPTYHAQGDLFFSIFAGHGEFPKIVVAPGDAKEAFDLAAESLNLAWKFQVPVILLSDKHLSESTYSAEINENAVGVEQSDYWRGSGEYKRYLITENGVSPLAFPGTQGATVKLDSYEHDEYGITTEDPTLTKRGHEKRLRKTKAIEDDLRKMRTVKVYGNSRSDIVLVTWGSTKGAVVETAKNHGLMALQPLYLDPLPTWELRKYLKEPKQVICVEVNSRAQLSTWLRYNGLKAGRSILKYDGRPFAVDELDEKIKEAILG